MLMKTAGNLYSYQGHVPRIASSAYVAPGAMVIGRVEMAPHSSVWFNCVLRGDLGTIEIGEGSNIQDLTTVHIEGSEERPDGQERSTVIGRNVTIGHNCVVHSCVIEDDCLIGMGAVLLGGARIGKGAIVGAGTLVLEDTVVPPYSLIVGNPGRVRKTYAPEEAHQMTEAAARIYRARIGRFREGLAAIPAELPGEEAGG
jgi:carbonic anhydrase/acetyltransferase-like protein (isoleucine patch superfamily)